MMTFQETQIVKYQKEAMTLFKSAVKEWARMSPPPNHVAAMIRDALIIDNELQKIEKQKEQKQGAASGQ